jgi:hypothetical protein
MPSLAPAGRRPWCEKAAGSLPGTPDRTPDQGGDRLLRFALAICGALLLLPGMQAAFAADNSLNIDGAFQAEAHGLRATVFLNERIGIWMLQVGSTRAYRKATGSGYAATLFFSKKFVLREGRFPVRFRYLGKENTLGASLVVSGKNRAMFSHDTNGTIEFTRVDDRLQGSFEYTTFDRSKDPRRSVRVRGTFDVERGAALR